MFSAELTALDSRTVSPFMHSDHSTNTSHLAPPTSSRHSHSHTHTHQHQQHHQQHHQHQPNHPSAIAHSNVYSHSSRTSSPQDPVFASNSARYPVPQKQKTPQPAPKYSLSAPTTATESRPQTVSQHSSENVNNILSMDAVKKSTVRFIYGLGHSKTVYISGCFNGDSIKRKALKKNGVKDLPENWVVHIADNELGTTTRAVSDIELTAICHDQDRKERNRLMLCAVGVNPSIKQLSKSQQILRESISSPSQTPITNGAPSPNDDFDSYDTNANDDNSGTLTPSTAQHTGALQATFKDSTLMANENSKKLLRKFYGQRPPSELISHNLKEYFPEVGPAELKETIRNSIIYKRMSRMSRISQRSSIASAWGYADDIEEEVPPLPSVDDFMSQGDSPAFNDINQPVSTLSSYGLTSPPVVSARLSSLEPLAQSSTKSNALDPNARPITPQSAGPAPLSKRSSSLSLLSNRLSEPNTANARIQEQTGQRDVEEELMAAFNKEQSGPSRWIKGTVIGSGSFGTVYLGMNSITGELMAVKQVELLSDKETEQRKMSMIDALQREMNLLRDLQHENIVQYLGSNSEEKFLNIFLEYVPGGSVATMLSNYGAFEESLIRNFVRQILQGLKYLHNRSIIHRDIKGANVLVDNKGGIKISDFGISKKLEARFLTAEKNRVSLQGSVYWMAPEVVKQTSYTLKADIWSLGCLIVEMFTGTHPFPEFSQMQAIFKIGTSIAPKIPEDCSAEAQNFLQQTFEIDFNKRPTAEELLKMPLLKPLL